MNRLISWTPFSDAPAPWVTLFSYVFDYAIIIILAIIYGALDKLVTPFNQRFSLTDITIQYPFAVKERIPIAEALVISFAFPLLAIAFYTLVVDSLLSRPQPGRKGWTFKDRLWDLNCGVLGLLLAQGAAFCITGTLKNLVGRPRPDLLDRCRPPAGAADAPVFGLTMSLICTQTNKSIMQDGFRSFPSGHSSSSFAGLFYLSLYLSGKLSLLDQRGEVWRTVVVIVPTMAAACIAVSRIMDYRHHPFDVLFGSALGILCAWGAYRQYFPPLNHSWLKGRAYPIRQWGVSLRTPAADYTEFQQRKPPRQSSVRGADDPHYSATQPRHQHLDQLYSLEPMRPSLAAARTEPDFEHVAMASSHGDDTDYEHIRSNTASPSSQGISAPRTARSVHGNTFRVQVASNESRRGFQRVGNDNAELSNGQASTYLSTSNRD